MSTTPHPSSAADANRSSRPRRGALTGGLAAGLLAATAVALSLAAAAPASAAVPGLTQVAAVSPVSSVDKNVTVTCPPGRFVIGAGANVIGGGNEVALEQISPDVGLRTLTVRASEVDPTPALWSVRAVAQCAFAPPGLLRVITTSPTNSTDKTVAATCPAGLRVLGAGYSISGGRGEVVVNALTPNAALDTVEVQAGEDAVYAPSWSVSAIALCTGPLPGLSRAVAATVPNSRDKGVVAVCPAGTVAIGAGAGSTGAFGEIALTEILPGANTVTEFGAEEDPVPGPWTGNAEAICATP